MGAYLEGEYFPGLKAEEKILQHLRVKDGANWGDVAIAGDEAFIGTAKFTAYRAGERVTIRDKRAPGYHAFVSGGAITAGADITTAAGGKVVSGTGGVVDIGKAINSVGGADEIVYARPA